MHISRHAHTQQHHAQTPMDAALHAAGIASHRAFGHKFALDLARGAACQCEVGGARGGRNGEVVRTGRCSFGGRVRQPSTADCRGVGGHAQRLQREGRIRHMTSDAHCTSRATVPPKRALKRAMMLQVEQSLAQAGAPQHTAMPRSPPQDARSVRGAEVSVKGRARACNHR